jgi:hypothetical protein
MMYGASRAQELINTHPNHEHLLKVLKETRAEVMSGRFNEQHSSDSDSQSDDSQWSSSSPPERYSSTPQSSSSSSFDDDSLLTDEEISRQNQGGTTPNITNFFS